MSVYGTRHYNLYEIQCRLVTTCLFYKNDINLLSLKEIDFMSTCARETI